MHFSVSEEADTATDKITVAKSCMHCVTNYLRSKIVCRVIPMCSAMRGHRSYVHSDVRLSEPRDPRDTIHHPPIGSNQKFHHLNQPITVIRQHMLRAANGQVAESSATALRAGLTTTRER